MVANPLLLVEAHALAVTVTGIGALAWVGAEAVGRRSTWRQGAERRPPSTLDRGTYPAIAISIAVGMCASTAAFLLGFGGYLPDWVSLVGLALVAAGLVVRVWALSTLGRFFTMPITLRDDHEIVRAGPYAVVRHPAYTGGYLTVVGMAVALGTPVGIVVTGVVCLAAYVHRIRVEEATLVSRFGDAYRRYTRETWRLLPLVF